MITKAYIKEKIGKNKYKVRIPIFEDDLNNESEFTLYEATLSYSPGNLDSYNIDDVVFVSFEDNDYNNVIIIGKLYQGDEDNPTNFQNTQRLDVKGETNLSSNTYINGEKLDNRFLKKDEFDSYVEKINNSIGYKILW